MKKCKLVLAIIVVLVFVGYALATKQHFSGGFNIFVSTFVFGPCADMSTGLYTTTAAGPEVFYATYPTAGACPYKGRLTRVE